MGHKHVPRSRVPRRALASPKQRYRPIGQFTACGRATISCARYGRHDEEPARKIKVSESRSASGAAKIRNPATLVTSNLRWRPNIEPWRTPDQSGETEQERQMDRNKASDTHHHKAMNTPPIVSPEAW